MWTTRVEISNYVHPPAHWFWEWTDEGKTVTSSDGRAVTFRPELKRVFEALRLRGLPPLDGIIIVLSACRENWSKHAHFIPVLDLCFQQLAPPQTLQRRWKIALRQAASGLQRIHSLPALFRKELEHRLTIVEIATETMSLALPATRVEETTMALDTLSTEIHSDTPTSEALLQRIDELCQGLESVTSERILARAQTSLDSQLRPAELELPISKLVRQAVADLRTQSEYEGFAQLAMQLNALFHFNGLQATTPIGVAGGDSSIANRGPLHRLLLSELAQDNDTLVARLCQNEALFLHPEPPATRRPIRRWVMIDNGIRLWGKPRIFGAAAALALAMMSPRDSELTTFRPDADRAKRVDLTSAAGVMKFLEYLSPELHPGLALSALCDVIPNSVDKRPASAVDTDDELWLITSPETLADEEFREHVSRSKIAIDRAVTVDRDGRLQILAQGRGGATVLRSCQQDLSRLTDDDDRSPPSPPPATSLVVGRPAIMDVTPFPLLLPHPIHPRRIWGVETFGALSVAADGRLMHWQSSGFGARQVTTGLPSRNVLWYAQRPDRAAVRFVVGFLQRGALWSVTIRLDSGFTTTQPIATATQPIRCVCESGGSLFVVYRRNVDVVDMDTGNRLASLAIQGKKWLRDRFFRGQHEDWVLAAGDPRYAWERLPTPQRGRPDTWFDTPNGPVGILSNGTLYSTHSESYLGGSPFQLGRWDPLPEGDMVRCQRLDNGAPVSIHVPSGEVFHGVPYDRISASSMVLRSVSPRNVRTAFTEIGVVYGGLYLRSARSAIHIRFDRSTGDIEVVPDGTARTVAHRRHFTPQNAGNNDRIALKTAEWRDGSTATLDTRGLLHLRSGDSSIPEVTIVLTNGPTAGWSPAIGPWGLKYFLGAKSDRPAALVEDLILKPFRRRLR